MIFVTLGSQKFQFNRLLKELDSLIENGVIKEDIFAQIGASTYTPKHYEFKDFLNQNEFKEKMKECSMVITHAGTGAIITALKEEKKVIAVPRLAKYGEHVDDHQLQILEAFTSQNYILSIIEMNELVTALSKIKTINFDLFVSNTHLFLNELENCFK